jgi:hypothetical protein
LAYRIRTVRPVEASTLLVIDMIGVTPLPPHSATTGASPSGTVNTPDGLVASSTSPSVTLSSSQVDTAPPGTRLTVTVSGSPVSGALDIE